jgi:hypothetical protein
MSRDGRSLAYNPFDRKLFMAANPHTRPKRSRSVSERRPVRWAKASDPEERRELIRRAASRVRTKASIDFLRDVRGR